MEAIRKEAEECWIPDAEDPTLRDLDEPRFIELVRKSYEYISEPDESIYYSDDGDAVNFTDNILAEQAVLHENIAFFLKIIEECELSDQNDLFFAAVVKTKRFRFIEILLEYTGLQIVNYLYGFSTTQKALDAIECFSFVVPVEKLFSRRVKQLPIYEVQLALAFLQNGIPFEQVIAGCDKKVIDKLKEEDV